MGNVSEARPIGITDRDREGVDAMREPWDFLPDRWNARVRALPASVREAIEEVRFRVGRPVFAYGSGSTVTVVDPDPLPADALEHLVLGLVEHSLYARQDQLRQAFFTLPGGHRVGIAGRAVLDDGKVRTVRDISGLNLRRGRAIPGVAEALWAALGGSDPCSLLVVSPPRAGKTTLIRDVARVWSDQGHPTVVIDERGELAGMVGAEAAHALGAHTDVLDGWPKASGLNAAIRTLGPHLVVVDELGSADEADAVEAARRAGVEVVASVHGDLTGKSPGGRMADRLWRQGVFAARVTLSRRHGPGTLEEVRRLGRGGTGGPCG